MGNIGGHETSNHAVSVGYLDVYDIDTDSWTVLSSNAPHPRDHTGGALIDGRLCVGGGREGGTIDWPLVAETVCYDFTTQEWVVEESIPNPRAGSLYGTSCDGHLIVAGGEGAGIVWDNVDVFDGKTWTSVGSLQRARYASAIAVDCRVNCTQLTIASGGESEGGGQESYSVEAYFLSGQDTPCNTIEALSLRPREKFQIVTHEFSNNAQRQPPVL